MESTATRLRAHAAIAHLGYVELLTPVLDESLRFFTELLSLVEVERDGESVYLRCWDDYEVFSVKLTSSEHAGVGAVGLRAASPEALEHVAEVAVDGGHDVTWHGGALGRGRTCAFRDPDGHRFEVYFESEHYQPPEQLRPSLKNQGHRRPNAGIGARRLDHVNYLASDVERNGAFLRDVLGARLTEQIVLDDGVTAGAWFTFTNKGYDLVYARDNTGTRGRLHHIAFAVDQREDILRGADLFLEDGVHIETGPHKHAIQQTFFLYVWEPGLNRVETVNAGARLVLAPDWEPVTWTEEERKKGQAWGLKTIESFHTHGTPVLDEPTNTPAQT